MVQTFLPICSFVYITDQVKSSSVGCMQGGHYKKGSARKTLFWDMTIPRRLWKEFISIQVNDFFFEYLKILYGRRIFGETF